MCVCVCTRVCMSGWVGGGWGSHGRTAAAPGSCVCQQEEEAVIV